MAHFDGKKEFEGLCFLLILLKIVIADFRQGMIGKRLDLDPRVRGMSGRIEWPSSALWRLIREENPWDIENRDGISWISLHHHVTNYNIFLQSISVHLDRGLNVWFIENGKMFVRRGRKLSSCFDRIVKNDEDKRFLIIRYKYGRTRGEQIFQGIVIFL